ncbi:MULTISPECIES: type II toxin-antitoxin system mRNA interferase toxin, RelE/StbE family [unclassified Polynucleobacter]|uniref:type II toxin-antitoxin system mRNA interferase toxin, RelE/StbE family n=1 Tax=unclassified Polynucleobacter TaxID=2640945 RepID=UPI000A6985AD|nr:MULTISPECIES: type II toxin-antitoxin system mRNA interferase toxin, RelE/StbE family [unclassified Polynucleobacter]
MRRIERTTQFKKDYKREIQGRYRSQLASELIEVLNLLIDGLELPARYFDHALIGRWKDF